MNIFTKFMLASSYLWVLSFGMLGPLYAIFAPGLGGSIVNLTGAYATYYIAAGVVTVFVGYKATGLKKRWVMMTGYIIAIFATFGYLFVDSPSDLFIIEGVAGLAIALSNPTWYALFSENIKGTNEKSWGWLEGGNNIMTGISVFIGGLIYAAFGFDVLFITMGTILCLATVVQGLTLRL